MLDDTPHGTSARTKSGVTVWQIPRAALDQVRGEHPEIFYRLVGMVARRLSDRLRAASERLVRQAGAPALSNVRREHDSLGEREVPNHAYYGVQTVRAIENFPFSGIHVSHYEHFVRALACVKKPPRSPTPSSARSTKRLATRSPRRATKSWPASCTTSSSWT